MAENCPDDEVALLRAQFNLSDADVYRVDGPVNLHRLETIYNLVDAPDHKFVSFVPKALDPTGQADLFELIGRTDVLLHHPFQSFSPVVELLRQAADDPCISHKTDGVPDGLEVPNGGGARRQRAAARR